MKGGVAVRLRFQLARAGRLFLVVRGPVPSCRVAAAIPVRGRKGLNTVDFAGRAAGRVLSPGTYALSLSTERRPPVGTPATLVKVVSKTRTVPDEHGRAPTCATRATLVERASYGPLDREAGTTVAIAERQSAGNAPRQVRRTEPTSLPPVEGEDQHDVLGIAIPAPFDGDGPSGPLETLISIFILTLIGALLLTMVTLVTRFFRGTWNP